MNNGVRIIQGSLLEELAPEPPKYRVFKDGDRYQIARHVFGTNQYYAIEDSRSEKFAQLRVEALNSGKVKA